MIHTKYDKRNNQCTKRRARKITENCNREKWLLNNDFVVS